MFSEEKNPSGQSKLVKKDKVMLFMILLENGGVRIGSRKIERTISISEKVAENFLELLF